MRRIDQHLDAGSSNSRIPKAHSPEYLFLLLLRESRARCGQLGAGEAWWSWLGSRCLLVLRPRMKEPPLPGHVALLVEVNAWGVRAGAEPSHAAPLKCLPGGSCGPSAPNPLGGTSRVAEHSLWSGKGVLPKETSASG